MQRSSRILVWMALLIVAASSIGLAVVYLFNIAELVMFVIIADGAITFSSLLLLSHGEGHEASLNEAAMRSAIAGTVVVVYIVLLGIATVELGHEKHTAMSETLINSFTTIVGIVIASYFGASAYVQTRTQAADRDKSATPPAPQRAAT